MFYPVVITLSVWVPVLGVLSGVFFPRLKNE